MTAPEATRVAGYCPACRHSSLILGADGRLVCRRRVCPHPTAADELLADPDRPCQMEPDPAKDGRS